jgi:hypothetical protein
VYVFNAAGEYQTAWTGIPGQAFGGGYVSVAADNASGEVYVTSTVHGATDVFEASGGYITQFSHFFKGPQGTAVDQGTHKIYVSDNSPSVVDIFSPGPVLIPDVTTGSVSNTHPTSVTFEGTVNPDGVQVTACKFEYRTATGSWQSVACASEPGSGSSEVPVSAEATGLQPNTTYHYRLTASNANGANSGEDATFTTPGPPAIDEESSANITPTSADIQAQIKPNGIDTTYHFQYGTSTAYGTTAPIPDGDAGSGTVDVGQSVSIEGLSPDTTYHYRVVATNSAGTTFGEDKTFASLPPVSIDSTSASQVNATSARLEAELNPHGLASEYRFEYGPTTAYGTSIPIPDGSAGSSKADTTVENLIQELLPSTTYHYRVIAHNALNKPGEVVEGPDRSFTTQGPASILPDGRTWELVSPPNKHGAPLEPITEEGGLIQTAPNGGAFAYVALGPTDTDPKGVRSPSDTQLLATRGPAGWSTQDITTPHEEITPIFVGFPSEYQFFSEDLSASAVAPAGATPLSSQATERTPYRREADGEFVALVTPENTPPGAKFGGEELPSGFRKGVEFLTATPDLSHMILTAPQILAPGFQPGFEATKEANLYELAGGKLTLVSVLPNEQPASEAGLSSGVGGRGFNVRGAISTTGSRVVFETTGSGVDDLYLRDVTLGKTVQLDEPQPGAAGGTGAAVFQAANSDASKVFFTDASRLTPDSTARLSEPDLYMCEMHESEGHLACALSDLSVDHNAGEAANVQGEVSAIDASGTHVYFAANGVLTSTPNARGEVAVPGVCNSEGESTCNLYSYDTAAHQIALVAVLSSHDDPDWAGRTALAVLGNLTARSSPDGHYFTFMSRRSLTGYDNRDARSGEPDEEVFQFDSSSGKLSCVSCNPTGARPDGVFDKPGFPGLLVDHASSWGNKNGDPRWLAGSIPGWTLGPSHETSLYQSRYLSNSGREFFNSADALVPQDTNNVNDVYEFEPPGVGDCTSSAKSYSATSGGCVALISSGTSKEESAFLDASESGDEVFFLTNSRLLGSDVDSAFDVYDAHVCSSSSPCPPPPSPPAPVCEGDTCQNPTPPPGESTPSSLTYKGPGNATPVPVVKAKARPLTRAQKLTRALNTCRKKHHKLKRMACERQARKRYGPSTARRSAAHPNRRVK